MKFITKRKEPLRLRAWRRLTKTFADASFDTHQFPKDEVKRSLVDEQGGLCAYTMIRIDISNSHIEHLKPRTISKGEGKLHETTDYAGNLVACYPNTGLAETSACPFGADFRKSNWDSQLFVTPLDGTCENRFRFNTDGKVSVAESDSGARWTSETLNLNEPSLVELRRSEIRRHGLSLNAGTVVTASEARRIAEDVCRKSRGQFAEFCIAIRHAALDYASKLEKAQQRRKFAGQSRRRKDR